MEIRIRNTGEVMTEITFRATFRDRLIPETLTAEWLAGFIGGCDVVFEGPQAQPGRYQIAFRDGVEQDAEGRWFTKYSVADLDAEGIAAKDTAQAANVREQRNAKLAETDWMVLRAMEGVAPVPENIIAQRRALRDIPQQAGFPWEVQWPE